MKQTLYTLIFACSMSLSYAQSFKKEYAQKLSNQFNYVEAFPVWEELVNESIEAKNTDFSSVRKAIEAAYGSEQYVVALKWSDFLLAQTKETTPADYLSQFQLLLLNKKYEGLTAQVEKAQALFPTNVDIQRWKSEASNLTEILDQKSAYDVTLFRSVEVGEEFSAFPFEEGVIFSKGTICKTPLK